MLTVWMMFLFETLFFANTAFAQEFSFPLQGEPHSLDPALISSTDAAFFFPQIYRGLYRYQTPEGLIPEGAKSCEFTNPLLLVCELSSDRNWSDGTDVVAADYVRGWQHLVRPNSRSPAVELLTNVKNTSEIFAGNANVETLGIKAVGTTRLEISFKARDPDFLYKLASPVLVPVKSLPFPDKKNAKKVVTNGPYKIVSWTVGKNVRLIPNAQYKLGNQKRPPVEVLFITDDETALSLYKAGRLKMVRRLQAHQIPDFKAKPDFFEVPVARFDYIGFGPELHKESAFRKALSLSVDYAALQKLVFSPGRFGCPSLPDDYLSQATCLPFNLQKAKDAWLQVPQNLRSRRWKFAFSGAGGDHIKRAAEFFQNQWKTNLGAQVDLEQTENAVFLGLLRKSPPAMFRKGVQLDRPTCLAALENFRTAAPENFIHLNSQPFNSVLEQLTTVKTAQELKATCSTGVDLLINEYRIIPLGQMFFAFLVKPEFKGWRVNELNQLDLSNLQLVK